MSWSLIQSNLGRATAANNASATFPSTTTEGNLIIVSVTTHNSGSVNIQVTDSNGDTYVQAGATVTDTNNASHNHKAIFYLKNCPSVASLQITATDTNGDSATVAIYEYAGADPENPLDITDSAIGSSATPTSNSFTPTQNNSLIFVGEFDEQTGANTAGTNYTLRQHQDDNSTYEKHQDEDRILTTAAATTATMNISGGTSTTWIILVAVFRGAPGNNGRLINKPQRSIIDWNNPITKDLVLNFLFTEKAGSVKEDVHGITYAITNGAIARNIDRYGLVLSPVASSSQYVSMTNQSYMHPTDFLSIEALIAKSDWATTSTGEHILSCTSSGGFCLDLNEGASGNIGWVVRANGAYQKVTFTSTGLVAGAHHLMGTYDGQILRLYVDGVQVGSTDLGSKFAIQYAVGNGLTLFADASSANPPGADGSYFNDKIYYCRMWNRPVTAGEVKQLAQNPWRIYKRASFLR